MSDFSPFEQLLLELQNRARLDPAAESARYGIEVNQDFPAGTLTAYARQPLAPSQPLLEAARGHSKWMIERDEFSHTGAGSSTPGDRMEAAGYSLIGAWNWGENLAWRGSTGKLNLAAATLAIHKDLFLSPAHRFNLLVDVYREAGTGMADGLFTTGGTTFKAIVATENFARSASSDVFVTGVAIRDRDRDNFYDIGEGRAGIAITLSHDGVDLGTGTTSAAGGYALRLPAGVIDVSFSGGGLATGVNVTVDASNGNAKVDLVNASKILSSATTTLGPGAIDLVLLGAADLDGTGNASANVLSGNRGANQINGHAGNDKITGGGGRDVLTGGEGADLFLFTSCSDTGNTAGTRDHITDFTSGVDKISLAAIDARTNAARNQAFTWIDNQDFHLKAGELRYFVSEANIIIAGDVNGDGQADFQLQLDAVLNVTKFDFVL